MITLQFLADGAPFLVPLDPHRSLEIGAAEGADVRLEAAEVRPRHARIVPEGDGFRIERASDDARIVVNGEDVEAADLKVGDRLSIGQASVVVGRQQRRSATADDVLRDRVGGRRRRASSRGGAWKLVVLGLLVVGAGVGAFLLSEATDRPPAELARVEDLRQRGRFDEARRILDGLRSWAGDAAARRDLLDREQAALSAVEEAVAAGSERLRAEASRRTYAELFDELAANEEVAPTPSEREAARLLRADLREIIEGVQYRAPDGPVEPLDGAPAGADPVASGGGAGAATPDAEDRDAADSVQPDSVAAVAGVLAAVEAQVADRAFVQALETLQLGLASADAAAAVPLRERLDRLEATVRRESRALVARADTLAEAGDLDEAVALLSRESWRFPAIGDLSSVSSELAARRVELERRGAGVPVPTGGVLGAGDKAADAGDAERDRPLDAGGIAGLQATLRELRDRELAGDLEAAATLSARAAAQIGDADPTFARRMRGQASDYGLVAEMVETLGGALARAVVEGPVSVPTADGTGAVVTGVDLQRVRLQSNRGEETLTWLELDPATVAGIARERRAGPRAWLGVAVHAYRQGARDAAEAALRKALEGDRQLAETVDGIIARGRGDALDSRYQAEGGQFVSVRTVEARKVGQKLQRDLATRLKRADFEGAEALLAEAAQGAPEVRDAIVVALQDLRQAEAEALAKLPIRKTWDELAKLRDRLDGARDHARDLIYDEEKYFYPFRPPQVSAERAAEYWPVQQEIDARVAALRDVWGGRSPTLRVPRDLGERVAVVDWIDARLGALGAPPAAEAREATEWLRSLPAAGDVTLANFARSAAERFLLDEWDRIRAFNERTLVEVPDGARRQFEITNDYRAMFGHRPLAANLKLFRAAQGHSDEMSTLGYFSHFSPTEGRRSPYERMRLEGYNQGASENIAQNGSALGAHNAWLHSAGHHRNLLNPNHKEFGVGVAGRYYTQNFGRGTEFEAELGR